MVDAVGAELPGPALAYMVGAGAGVVAANMYRVTDRYTGDEQDRAAPETTITLGMLAVEEYLEEDLAAAAGYVTGLTLGSRCSWTDVRELLES